MMFGNFIIGCPCPLCQTQTALMSAQANVQYSAYMNQQAQNTNWALQDWSAAQQVRYHDPRKPSEWETGWWDSPSEWDRIP